MTEGRDRSQFHCAIKADLRACVSSQHGYDIIERADYGALSGRSDKAASGVYLGSHRAGREGDLAEPGRTGAVKRALSNLPEVKIDSVDIGGDDQAICMKRLRQHAAGGVLIDNGLHAAETLAIARGSNRNAATSGSNDQYAV